MGRGGAFVRNLLLKLPDNLFARLLMYAEDKNLYRVTVIRRALHKYLKEEGY